MRGKGGQWGEEDVSKWIVLNEVKSLFMLMYDSF